MLGISNQKVDKTVVEKKVYSLKLLQTPRSGRVLAYWIVGLSIVIIFCLFLPWQQNIEGTGSITALTPQDRPQEVPSVIAGQIRRWHIQEGQFISEGDTILVLSEVKAEYFDPEQLVRLREQVDAKEDAIDATRDNIRAIDVQISALETGLGLSLDKARNKLRQARFKVTSDSADFEAIKRQLFLQEDLFKRSNSQYEKGLMSLNEYQSREAKLQEMRAKVVATQNKYAVSQQELINARIELNSLQAEYQEKIFKAQSDKSYYQTYLATSQGELSESRNKYANIDIRTNQYVIRAPQDGFIVKTLRAGIGENIKEGDAVVTIQPARPRVAVELYVRAMDVPLVTRGREVRLEFDGWPALQFSGGPNVSVGTFGGVVTVIDQVGSEKGEYRLLITPKEGENEQEWPEQLRLGAGAYGWVMLEDVPVWYEIWRRFNGFPPSLYEAPGGEEKKEPVQAKK
ncbi:MAG: HlyD family secretion protein [Thermonemataceae bacterium]